MFTGEEKIVKIVKILFMNFHLPSKNDSDDLAFRQCNIKSSTFLLLLSILAVVDSVIILQMIWDYTLIETWNLTFLDNDYLRFYFLHPFKSIIFSLETYLLVSIAVERYLAVCR